MALAAIQKPEKEKNTTYAKIIIGDGDKWDFPARTVAGWPVGRTLSVTVAVVRFRDAGIDEKERRRDGE